MLVFLTSTHHLTQPLILENEELNLVIACHIHSTQAISIKVKNLIILGDFLQDQEAVLFSSKEDTFFMGKMIGKASLKLIFKERLHVGRTEEVVEKIRTLGLDIVLKDDEVIKCTIPKGSVGLYAP